jgi:preprotein translocase subunit YajC
VNSVGFLLIIVAFGFLWFVLVRPQKRRQVAQQQMLSSLAVGDEVLTAGGLYGEVIRLGEEEITLEIAPGVEVRVARRAIAGIVPGDETEEPGEAEEHEVAVAESPTGGDDG